MAKNKFSTADAVSAARGEMRHRGLNPDTEDANSGYSVVDQLYKQDKELLVSKWYDTASDYQRKDFDRQWRAKQKESIRQEEQERRIREIGNKPEKPGLFF